MKVNCIKCDYCNTELSNEKSNLYYLSCDLMVNRKSNNFYGDVSFPMQMHFCDFDCMEGISGWYAKYNEEFKGSVK